MSSPKAAGPETVTVAEYRALLKGQGGKSKYGNIKTEVDGVLFDSKREAARYRELKLLLATGEVSDLELQPAFPMVVNGQKIGVYTGDFSYVQDGRRVVEDVKSKYTAHTAYRLRKRLVKALYGIDIQEVT